jgi:hypothetical protein
VWDFERLSTINSERGIKYQEIHRLSCDNMPVPTEITLMTPPREFLRTEPVTTFRSAIPERTGLATLDALRVPANRLFHEFIPSRVIDKKVVPILQQVIDDARAWFRKENGFESDNYNPDHGEAMRLHMRSDERLLQAMGMLKLPRDQVQKIYLPWWNESIGSEIRSELMDGGVRTVLGSCHSYQLQMIRDGYDIPSICSVSVVGFVRTSDDWLVISLRGGANLPNTYYFSAGYLNMTQNVRSGRTSICQSYLRELKEEYGMSADDVAGVKLLCKTVLHGGERNTAYVFVVRTPLTFEKVCSRCNSNPNEDRKEHLEHIPLRPDKDSVEKFVSDFYKGVVRNDPMRPYSARVLLPQGAAPLLFYAGGIQSLPLMDELAARYEQPV